MHMPEHAENPTPAQNGSIESRIDLLMELSVKFGGQDKIPKGELGQLGYERVKLRKGTRLQPLRTVFAPEIPAEVSALEKTEISMAEEVLIFQEVEMLSE